MRKFKKSVMAIATLALVAFFYLLPSRASEISSNLVKPDTMYFTGCWGSNAEGVSCTNGNATIYGCEPQLGSFCGGVREIPD